MSDLDDHEARLLKEVAALHAEFRRRAKPYIDELVKIQCLRPIPPMIINFDQLPQALRDQITKDNHATK